MFEIRPMIKFVAEQQHNAKLFGAEIGVWKGENAENILQNLPMQKLYLIDPYLPYIDGDIKNKKITDPRPHQKEAEQRLEKFDNKIRWIHKDSIIAGYEFNINYPLDFVYLDGCHRYEVVYEELEAYWPTIKQGGVLGGHDINFYGVMRAVGEFCEARNLHPMTDKQDWWIVKP